MSSGSLTTGRQRAARSADGTSRRTRRRPLGYVGSLLRLCLRSRLLWVMVAVLALLFGAYQIKPNQHYLSEDRDYFASPNFGTKTGGDSRTLSQQTRDYLSEEKRLAAAIVASQTDEEFARLYAEYENLVSDYWTTAPGVVRDESFDSAVLFYARRDLANRIVALEHPVYYQSTSDFPLAFQLAFGLHTLSYLFLLAPLVCALCVCDGARAPGRMLRAAPVATPLEFLGAALAAVAASLVALVVVCLPACLFALVRNGMGDFSYPVVYIATGTIHYSTLGLVAVQFLALYAAISLLLSLIVMAFSLFRRSTLGFVAMGLLMGLPLVPSFSQGGVIPGTLMPLVPSSYMDFTHVTGYPTYYNGLDLMPAARCTFASGIACTLAWSAVVVLLTLAAIRIRRALRARAARQALSEGR